MKMKLEFFGKVPINFIILIPLVLSAFIHMWNPVGFPAPHHDEDTHYIPRALLFMMYGDPQKEHPNIYDHPFFGQILLGSLFKVIGYPQFYIPTGNSNLEFVIFLYTVPRIIMGSLAVFDTFLVYKIADIYYGRRVAFISSILFAVMPITWLLRMVLLDNLLLPFLLSSILILAYATQRSKHRANHKVTASKFRLILLLISGILLGLAIFTKVPAFTIIPLYIFLICSTMRNKKVIAVWLAPVILIALIWPLYAVHVGNFNLWIKGVVWQTGGRIDQPLSDSIVRFFQIDPVLLLLGLSGICYAASRRDYFLLLWMMPFVLFTLIVHFVSLFHLVFLLPALCISGAKLILDASNKIQSWRSKEIISVTTITAITIFGLTSSLALITMDLSNTFFKAVSFTNNYLPKLDEDSANPENKVTVVGPVKYYWIPQYVFGKSEHFYKTWEHNSLPIKTKKILFIMPTGDITRILSEGGGQAEWLRYIYNNTHTVALFNSSSGFVPSDKYFPYTSLKEIRFSEKIEIRANY